MRNAKIINLYKHNIVHKNIKNKQPKLFMVSMLVCMIVSFSFMYLYGVNSVVKNSTSVFNPISELYRDVETASFVSGSINFIVPIKTDEYVINDSSIDFKTSSSIMVYAPANGVVESINVVGKKVIKIKHAEGLYSIIANVEIVGVKVGDIVKQGKEIATATPGKILTFSIEKDGKSVGGIYLNKSYVKWKSVE